MQALKLQLFILNIEEAFKTRRESFSVYYMKRVAGMIDLQKLGKAIAHSGDVTMNIRFWWEGGTCIQVRLFLCENFQLSLMISPPIATE